MPAPAPFRPSPAKGMKKTGVPFPEGGSGVTPTPYYFFFLPKWRMWPIFSCLVRM